MKRTLYDRDILIDSPVERPHMSISFVLTIERVNHLATNKVGFVDVQ